jgi:ABC-type dipeptide/oligopeptide/nickel transport system permease component
MTIRTYLVRRLILLVVVVLGISVITFTVARVIPTDPAVVYAGPMARGPALEEARRILRLDRPLYEQYLSYMGGLAHGDWGSSLRTKRSVLGDIMLFLPVTLQLVITSMLIAVIAGIGLGAFTAQKKGRFIDFVMRIFAVGGVSLPSFFIALLFQVVMFRILHLFPVGGMFSIETMHNNPITPVTNAPLVDALITGNFSAFTEGLRYLVLPVLALAAYPTGVVMRMTRSAMLESMEQDYIRMARAMGVPSRTIVYRYALKNALGPVLTVTGLLFAYSIIGAFFIELIFNWPGIGRYATTSILALDYPAIMGVTLMVALVYVFINLVVDLLLVWIDPRVVLS